MSSLTVGETELDVWTADETVERRQGLRDVDGLPDHIDGMVFLYESAADVSFVMDDTLIPLDVWWFNPDGVLVGTDEMTPCAVDTCADYPSPGPVLAVLETPAGEYQFAAGSVMSTVESS